MTESGLPAAFGEYAGCTCTLKGSRYKIEKNESSDEPFQRFFFLLNFDLSYNRTKFIQLFRALSTLGPHKLRCWHAGPLEDVKCSTKGKPSRTWSVIASRKVEAVPTLAGFDPGLSRWPRFELIFIDQFGRSIGDEVQSAVLREVVTAGNNSKRPMLAKCLLVLECSREIPWQR